MLKNTWTTLSRSKGMSQAREIEVRDSLSNVSAEHWNTLCTDGNPFVTHEFLLGLEATDCLGGRKGWHPRYFLLWADIQEQNELLAAAATYIKTNSYGEFVFDWAWADAYERNGRAYYPKLVTSIPYTPATGRRLLVRDDQPHDQTVHLLVAAIRQFCDTEEYSGAHWLFLTPAEARVLCGDTNVDGSDTNSGDSTTTLPHHGLLQRLDCQYHWHNDNYRDFDDFLTRCTAKRRKTIRRERRHVTDASLRVEQRMGHSLTDAEWHRVHTLYASTYDRKWGSPSLTLEFFKRMGATMGDKVLIVFAYPPESSNAIACSIMFVGRDTLYGRYWGCSAHYNSLHFEACYYQGIDFCITHGLQHFEPGAQGEHKITRGFEPTLTRSAHYIADPQFRQAIERFLTEESEYVTQRCAGLTNLLPFKAEVLPM